MSVMIVIHMMVLICFYARQSGSVVLAIAIHVLSVCTLFKLLFVQVRIHD